MIKFSIDVTKIEKPRLFEGKPRQTDGGIPKYLSGACLENRDGRDRFGNDGFIVQDVSKDEREQGIKGPIIGNWRDLDSAPARQTTAPVPPTPVAATPESQDDIPF